MFTRSSRSARHLRLAAGVTSAFFSWLTAGPSFGAALHRDPVPRGHARTLAFSEMRHIRGAQTDLGAGSLSSGRTGGVANDGGTSFPWEGDANGINTTNGNKLTDLPIVGWAARGGRLGVNFTLYHNSLSTRNADLGHHWSNSYDISLHVDSNSKYVVQWGDASAYGFDQNISGDFTAPAGIYDTLVTTSGTGNSRVFTLTTKNQIRYTFSPDASSAGNWVVTAITDRNNNALTIGHNSTNGNVVSITDPTSRVLTLGYTGSKLTSITDPLSRVWTISYNSTTGDLAQVNYPSVTVSSASVTYHTGFAYNTDHRITTITDRRGKDWTFAYNTNGSLASETDPLSNATTYSYNSGYTTVTDPNSAVTRHNYSSGVLSSEVDGATQTESFVYDSNHNKTTVTDKRGHDWTYTYDSSGNVLTATDPLSHTTTYTYNIKNDVLTVTTHLGHVTTYSYDTAGNLTGVSDPLSHATSITVNSYGQMTSSTDALSHSTSYTYDSDGNTNVVTPPIGYSTYGHDAVGRQTSVTDAVSLTTTTAFDALDRVTSVTAPGSRVTSSTYDAGNHVLTVTDPTSRSVSFTYDDDGRLASKTDGNSHTVSYGYDYAGNKTSFTDGRGKVTTYSYNGRNQMTGIGYADSTSQSYTYKATGELYTKTDGRGVTTTCAYDNAGRLTGKTYSDSTSSVSFGYDNDNRKTSMVDGTGTTTYSYDNASRLTSRAAPSHTVGFSYDNANRLSTRTIAGTDVTSFTYDDANRLTEVDAVGATQATVYTYDDAGRQLTKSLANDTIEYTEYDTSTGDTLGHLYTQNTAGTATISSYFPTYDSARRVTDEVSDQGSRDFTYDNAGQLTASTRSAGSSSENPGSDSYAYTYDASGNRTSQTKNSVTENYTYDDANKLLTAGVKTYTYDDAGNVIQVANSATSSSVYLTWDAEGRMKSVSDGTNTDTYTYNGLGQRVGKSDSTGTFSYTLEDDAIDSKVLSDGAATYIQGNGLISEVRGSSSPVSKYYYPDERGINRTLCTTNTADRREYDPFGQLIGSGNSGVTATPFGFGGQAGYQSDADTGLMLLGHRYYDASIGRFISRDPVQDGDNWYAYCSNDPVNGSDPEGEKPRHKTPGWVINHSKHRSITIIFDDDDNNVIVIQLPPGYWTNPKAVDVDFIGGDNSFPRWRHLGDYHWTGAAQIWDGPWGSAIGYVPGVPLLGDDPKNPGLPPNMRGVRPIIHMDPKDAEKRGWIRPIPESYR